MRTSPWVRLSVARSSKFPDDCPSAWRKMKARNVFIMNVLLHHIHDMKPLTSLFDLHGRTALVTGGSRGLGLEMAEGLAEAGASVMILARREQWLAPALEELHVKGYRAEGEICDVSHPDQVSAAVAKTIDIFG